MDAILSLSLCALAVVAGIHRYQQDRQHWFRRHHPWRADAVCPACAAELPQTVITAVRVRGRLTIVAPRDEIAPTLCGRR